MQYQPPEQNRVIDILGLIRYGWETYKVYLSFMIGVMITYIVLGVVPQFYFSIFDPEITGWGQRIFALLLYFLQIWIAVVFIKVTLLMIDDQLEGAHDMLTSLRIILVYFITNFLFMIMVLIGFLLLIVPGVYLYLRYQFFDYRIIEGETNPLNALMWSYYRTEGIALELFLLELVVWGLNIAGFLLLGVGLLVSYPVTMLAKAVVYRSLTLNHTVIPSAPYVIPE